MISMAKAWRPNQLLVVLLLTLLVQVPIKVRPQPQAAKRMV
jgi:hypothetical protein